jgi:hypothetical protein
MSAKTIAWSICESTLSPHLGAFDSFVTVDILTKHPWADCKADGRNSHLEHTWELLRCEENVVYVLCKAMSTPMRGSRLEGVQLVGWVCRLQES